MRTTPVFATTAFAMIAATNAVAQSATYPTKPIRMTVSSGAGGGLDFVSRLAATAMTESLGDRKSTRLNSSHT